MRRRVLAALLATVLAVAGVVMIALYVKGADERAVASLDPTDVLVVTKEIARGASAELGTNVEARRLPRSAVAPGTVTDIASLKGLVADTALHAGELLFRSRFTEPQSLTSDEVVVPPTLVQVTVKLEPERVIGGRLKAGDTVGGASSFKLEQKKGTKLDDGTTLAEDRTVAVTLPLLQKVLVTKVEQTTVTKEGDQPAVAQYITLAVASHDADRVVWSAEHGTIWLTLQRPTSSTDDTVVITQDNIDR